MYSFYQNRHLPKGKINKYSDKYCIYVSAYLCLNKKSVLIIYSGLELKVVCLVSVCDRWPSFIVPNNTLNSSHIGHKFIIADRKTKYEQIGPVTSFFPHE